MIKVHCLVSCLCEIIKRRGKVDQPPQGLSVDHRPYYFGVWDSAFDVTEQGAITYYSARTSHDHFIDWYRRFFGVAITEWYDYDRPKADNAAVFTELVDNLGEHQHVIVQIDMSLMPERENKFAQKPFPHFLMIYKTDNPDEWFMFDPDFRWEGVMPKARVIEAFAGNADGGGYLVDSSRIQQPSPQIIAALYEETMRKDANELTARLRDIVISMAEGAGGRDISMLLPAVKQLNIIVIRKYSYDYALMFFRDQLGLSEENYEAWCQQIRDLIQVFNSLQYLAVKCSMTGNREHLPQIMAYLDQADAIEFAIKAEIDRQYRLWKTAVLRPAEEAGAR
ncbi:DUF6005 family protein [Paenibacillus xanthanilyticus]|uniref:DUF6005 family protein n=1 Tax=Paenibacillus xanthanilyticus TaxID=1783531 RepID=A0ABV8JWG0_9BACL